MSDKEQIELLTRKCERYHKEVGRLMDQNAVLQADRKICQDRAIAAERKLKDSPGHALVAGEGACEDGRV